MSMPLEIVPNKKKQLDKEDLLKQFGTQEE